MVMDDFVAITLLRHGITKKNQEKKYIGWTDEPLCHEAKLALQQTSNCYPEADLIYCSDLVRCVETASIVYSDKIINKHPAFRECHFGDWEDKTYDQLKGLKDYRRWIDNIEACAPPNGEHYQNFKERVMNGWGELVEIIERSKVSEVILVTHSGPIRVLLERFAPKLKSFWEWHVAHGKGVQLVYSRNLLREGERCISLQEVPLTEKRNG